jgi:hypothetical protein
MQHYHRSIIKAALIAAIGIMLAMLAVVPTATAISSSAARLIGPADMARSSGSLFTQPNTATLPIRRLARLYGMTVDELMAAQSAMPVPTMINGVPFDQIVVMTDAVKDNIRTIYARGQELGNNPRAFSKIGDSTIDYPYFLASFDGRSYNLGEYTYLQPAIRYFAGSFGRKSAAVKVSMHAWTVMNPMWADKTRCEPNESPLACELRLNKPSIVLIRLGANDVGTAKLFEQKMHEVLDYVIGQGVIPVLSTKPDVRKSAQDVNVVMRRLAAEYRIPLWDFDRLGQTIPGQGLGPDGVHLTSFPPHDYTKADAFERGHTLQDLSALIALDTIWRTVTADRIDVTGCDCFSDFKWNP